MASQIEIEPVSAPLDASIRPPGSKSLTNRALVCAALARGRSTLHGALASEDTRVMIDALGTLGISIAESDRDRKLEVEGCGGKIPSQGAELYIANSGTTVRFLTALVSLAHGDFRLHGTPRMHERPISDLLESLADLGVNARSEAGTGCPPVLIQANGLHAARVAMRGNVSSQFLSALLMAAPYAEPSHMAAQLEIDITGQLVSKPYVEMTVAVMEAFGGRVTRSAELTHFETPQAVYQARTYEIEPDASAASYFWAAAAISGGRVLVEGLNRTSLQGDVAFCDCLAQMGCEVDYSARGTSVTGKPLRGIDVDMNAISDTVQTLAAVALFAEGPTTIRGVAHIRHKETDRIAALACELRKLGARVDEHHDGLTIVPGKLRSAVIQTYDDHRMAMSAALVGLRVPGVVIDDPDCTSKTYPNYFGDLAGLSTKM
ncbi:MAG TPA: 3-phosphoshikimate 1-carboxyvinyltransferase [Pirellulales bacterium]|nr:3-phosphoshikimate 1-carboxyvinyltransferase [Pirellulales bacterium]